MSRKLYQCQERGCWYRLLLWEHESTDHQCPHGGDSHYGLSETMRLVEKCWIMLDEVMDKLMTLMANKERTPEENLDAENLKGQARGMAEFLAMFMVPFFRTGDEVAAEAKRRWKARQRGEDYCSPGLGARQFEFPSDDKYAERVRRAQLAEQQRLAGTQGPKSSPSKVARTRVPAKGYPAIPDSVKNGILGARGKMTAEELSYIYLITKEHVEHVWEMN